MNPLTYIKIGLSLLALITVLGGGWMIKHSIEQNQMMRDQNTQLIQLNKEAEELKVKQSKLDDINTQILTQLGEKNEKVVERSKEVTHYIQSPEAQKSDRPSSDVLKNTIGMLRDED